MIRVRINGLEMEIPQPPSLTDFLRERGFPNDGIAVAVNETVIPKSLHLTTILRDRDVIEVIHAVGGGSSK